MVLLQIPLLVSASLVLAPSAVGFSPGYPVSNQRSIAKGRADLVKLFDLIKGEAIDAVPLNENLGGVGLAKRCAIKITGTAKKGEKCDADVLKDLVRYEKMCALNEAEAKSAMDKLGCTLICNGMGKELYYFPDDSARVEDRVIKLCPDEAAKDALASQSKVSIGDAKYVTINFLGGDDLIYGEVKQACDFLVEQLDIPDKAKIKFNSISFTDFEEGTCSVTVVANGGQSSGSDGYEESIARGEVYIYNGKWFTVTNDDITTATE
ncbi:hypothetical protein HJC23_010997 [Cyclotella cryptica]|uniref:Uncharacterized protein n=1 Tax=Cyclotella cryptica TaxID=29204 RepID=A0ABD3PXV2_9STRA|eukprot:CCRYP_010287-RA/>CCRYP_010287-RA protein AED:0.00 eAED:0.00 QI:119/-1/1/1/-1/1/1/78/264